MSSANSDDSWIRRNPPPWIAFPMLPPDLLPAYLTQGETEWWFDEIWRPFWVPLTREQKTLYLAFWNASVAWRSALELFDVDPDFDLEQDARESEEVLSRMKQKRDEAHRTRPFWKRWFTRQ